MTESDLLVLFSELIEQGRFALMAEGVKAEHINIRCSLDLRYDGQSYYLNVDWENIESASEAFHQLHHARYGHALDLPVELVNVRVALRSPVDRIKLAHVKVESEAIESVELYGYSSLIPMYQRTAMTVNQQIQGPALIAETVATSFISDGWRCTVQIEGHLLLEKIG